MSAYEKANAAFKATSKVLFKEEIGELKEFDSYLKECVFPYQIRKSSISGKDVMLGPLYPENAKIVSQDELDQLKFTPVDTNKIKDIDSLLEAVGENIVYCGNRLFGKNENISYVDNAIDCMNVINSHNVYKCKNSAYLSHTRENDHVFGASSFSKSKFLIHSYIGFKSSRCFESCFVVDSSDCMLSFNCTERRKPIFL